MGHHDMGVVTSCTTDSMCDDHMSCTVDHCGVSMMCTHADTCGTGMHCTATGCAAGGSCSSDTDCDDHIDCTLDSCGSSHTCNHDALDMRCSDAGAGYTCDPTMGCVRTGCGADADCNDHVDCTLDSCNASHMCNHDLVDSLCADAGAGARCSLSGCSVLPATCLMDSDCADGNFCNGDEICMGMELGCAPATAVRNCDDSDTCTVDMCDPTLPTDVADGGRPSVGRCVHTCTGTPTGCPMCPTGPIDYNGMYTLSPSVHQLCGLARTDSFTTLTSVTFTYSPPVALTVTAGMLSMTQMPAPSDGTFDATVVISGGCEEHYELMGMFTDADHFTATFSADFVDTTGFGIGCGTCSFWSTDVTGTRVP
jgi:hypothetical protein